MTDLVQRLRERARGQAEWWRDPVNPGSEILMEAAAEIERMRNECYKKCGVCEFDYGRAAPPVARSGDSEAQ